MLTHLKLRSCVAAATLMTFSALSIAQTADQNAAKDDSASQEVVITGSLLKRATESEAKPVVVLQAEDLVKSGATNPEKILQAIGQNQAFTISNTTIGDGTGGGSYANLRSLGSERTLVLLNGKRLVNSPFQTSGVDLNTVPTALIERVEVLATGGSATYGTDAVAGVINFITAKELQGVKASATASTPEAAGGGTSYLASLAGGFGSLSDNGWNIYGGVSYREQNILRKISRHFSSTGVLAPELGGGFSQNRSFPANYGQPGMALFNPAAAGGCVGPYLIPGATNQCNTDVLVFSPLQTPQQQVSFMTKGSLKIGENHMVSLEYVRGDDKISQLNSPQGPNNDVVNPNSPYFPGNISGINPAPPDGLGFNPALPIKFSWRLMELGGRHSEVRSDTDRAVAQLEGKLGDWDYQTFASISTSTVKLSLTGGYVNEPNLKAAFLGTYAGAPGVFLNPFAPQTGDSLTLLQSLEVDGEAQRAIGDLKVYGVQFNRELFELPGGRVAIALAADYKEESARFLNNFPITDSLPNVFAGAQNIRGDRNSKSASFEAALPVIKNLDVNLSARYDDYSDFGSTTNPGVGLTWKAINWLTLRGSYSKSFRAPTLYNIFQPNNLDTVSVAHNDPILCPNGPTGTLPPGGNVDRDCATNNNLTNLLTGGNPKVNPEKSDAYTVGFLLKPLQRTSFGVDYFNYDVKGAIGPLGDVAIFNDLGRYGDRIIRCQSIDPSLWANYNNCEGLAPNTVNPIAYVQDTTTNLGDIKTSGMDFTLDWSSETTSIGTFGFRYNGTYVDKYEYQSAGGTPFISRAGRFSDGRPVLRYIHTATVSLERGPVTVELSHKIKSGYTDCNAECLSDPDPAFFNNVKAYQVYDLSGIYRVNDKFTVFGTIGNLTNQSPPFSNGGQGFSTNFDARYADPFLRTYLITANYKF